ncbi:hypothetical protein EDD21DRAFT_385701 [Dissophora ornata]|nr:hypothetical protein EDD21DRAFT_385701 [Dissophora ornata]
MPETPLFPSNILLGSVPAAMNSQVVVGNLLLLGKIFLKQVLKTHSNFQQQPQHYQHQYQPPQDSTLLSRSVAWIDYPSSASLLSQLSSSSSSLRQALIPELARNTTTTSAESLRTFPILASSSPQVTILSPSSIHKHASAYSSLLPRTTTTSTTSLDNTSNSTAKIETNAAVLLPPPPPPPTVPLGTSVLFFPSTCHRSGYIVFLPDPAADLVLDLTPFVENIFRDNNDPTRNADEEDDGLTIFLFEEDEIPKRTWTFTIPRPPESVLPKVRMTPGQERERGKGRGRQGLYLGVTWELGVYAGFELRHWIATLNDTWKQKEVPGFIYDEDEWLRTETYETEPRLAGIVRAINSLEQLLIH